jgi:hypothetical protein
VLNARKALHVQVRFAWEMSGEKRSDYPLIPITPDQALYAISDFTDIERRLVRSLLIVGGLLPELISYLDTKARPLAGFAWRIGPRKPGAERRFDELNRACAWMKPPDHKYLFGHEMDGPMTLPNIFSIIPENPWVVFLSQMAEAFGARAWAWQISILRSYVDDLIPRIASHQDLRQNCGRIARWLRQLTPAQRSAWSDLQQVSAALNDEATVWTLMRALVRMTTQIYQNHSLAIQSLHAMRAPVVLIWDLENWILSPEYSKFRYESGASTRVPIPAVLQRVGNIVQSNDHL